MTRRTIALVTAALVALAVIGIVAVNVFGGEPTYRITAEFTETPGLYSDNAVDILGVPTGHVISVTPSEHCVEAGHGCVKVVLSLPKHVKIPAGAQAVIVAPNPVSDRFVQLSPPYVSGPVMKSGTVIPLSRAVVPLELDQIFSSVDQLSKTLGPAGANSNGALSDALHALATLANGNGAAVHGAITSIAAALPALTAHPDELKELIAGMDSITRNLASRSKTIDSLYDDIASVTKQFSDERATIAAAIANLQQGLTEVVTFIKANQANLTSSVTNLSSTVQAIMVEQHSLIQTFSTAALGFQNFNNTVQLKGACLTKDGKPFNCPVLWGRIDLPSDAAAIVSQYCGGNVAYSMLPIIAASAGLGHASATDTSCGAQIGLLQGRTGKLSPPGPKSPDLDLSHYLGSK